MFVIGFKDKTLLKFNNVTITSASGRHQNYLLYVFCLYSVTAYGTCQSILFNCDYHLSFTNGATLQEALSTIKCESFAGCNFIAKFATAICTCHSTFDSQITNAFEDVCIFCVLISMALRLCRPNR